MTHKPTLRPLAGVAFAVAACAAAFTAAAALAQPAPSNGPIHVDPAWHALTGARVITEPGSVVENATVVIRDGVIVSVQPDGRVPDGARAWDCAGLTITAGFIDAYAPVDAPKPSDDAPGRHWNAKVTPERSALDGEGLDGKTREALRELGFVAAAIAPKDGIFRGTGAVVSLSDPPSEDEGGAQAILAPAFQSVAMEAGGWNSSSYPGAQIGAIALIRQTFYDARWRADDLDSYNAAPGERPRPIPADALDAINATDRLPLLMVAEHEQDILRSKKIADEFDREMIALGSGDEYRRLKPIADAGVPVITTIDFPDAPDVWTIADAETASLRDLMEWEQAPTNLRRLADAGVPTALSTHEGRKEFPKNLRKAIEHGLSADDALAMLTTAPAEILGVQRTLGRIAPGMAASLVVMDGEPFAEKTEIRDVWIDGVRHRISDRPNTDFDGRWAVNLQFVEPIDGVLTVEDGKTVKVTVAERELKARKVQTSENRINFVVDYTTDDGSGDAGVYAMTAVVEGDSLLGTVVSPTGDRFDWTGVLESAGANGVADASDEKDDEAPEVPQTYGLPFGPYALDALPEQQDLLITNATIWTSGPDGILENASMLVRDGKVAAIGRSISAPSGVRTLDLNGRHVTPGLIDCHSHTGIGSGMGGVNEGTQAVTSEVRIADVINPDDINWYRQLAGGLTIANQLHGSANPIGGQNSVVKLRWGVQNPDDMRVEGAIPGIKFALGENVKQANWGEDFTSRYPQTRMGVEAVFLDRFNAAQDYMDAWDRWESMPSAQRNGKVPPRRDLELDALAEIIRGERLIHCHSYRQDEILMLCRIAEQFGFTIGTFQHVLEGYKVAEAIKEHAIGGSAFSDWWAYKFEVIDAIPENGAIMHEVGVVVSFNSDSDELARRMNLEAAKAVKYGGVDRAEALKFVTLNPAKQLMIDDRVGSLEQGKDADFVIWSGDPLSALSRCESTWIEGREYFSIEKDAQLRDAAKAERQRIIQKILAEGKPEKKDDEPETQAASAEDSDPALDALRIRNLRMLRSGIDPDLHRCGDCGVSLELHNH